MGFILVIKPVCDVLNTRGVQIAELGPSAARSLSIYCGDALGHAAPRPIIQTDAAPDIAE